MKKLLCTLSALVFALTSVSAVACTAADKAKDASQVSTPSKPKT